MKKITKPRAVDFSRGERGKYATKNLRIVGAMAKVAPMTRPAPSVTKAYSFAINGKLQKIALPTRTEVIKEIERIHQAKWREIKNDCDIEIVQVEIKAA